MSGQHVGGRSGRSGRSGITKSRINGSYYARESVNCRLSTKGQQPAYSTGQVPVFEPLKCMPSSSVCQTSSALSMQAACIHDSIWHGTGIYSLVYSSGTVSAPCIHRRTQCHWRHPVIPGAMFEAVLGGGCITLQCVTLKFAVALVR